MQTRPFHVYLLIFPMMFGMMLIAEFTTSLIPISGLVFGEWYQLFSEQMEAISDNTFMVFLLVSFFAPIIEEIIFRGIIQKGMINNGVKPRNAILFLPLFLVLFISILGNLLALFFWELFWEWFISKRNLY
jgi:membrane protease YdiL (CAAX protease family)